VVKTHHGVKIAPGWGRSDLLNRRDLSKGDEEEKTDNHSLQRIDQTNLEISSANPQNPQVIRDRWATQFRGKFMKYKIAYFILLIIVGVFSYRLGSGFEFQRQIMITALTSFDHDVTTARLIRKGKSGQLLKLLDSNIKNAPHYLELIRGTVPKDQKKNYERVDKAVENYLQKYEGKIETLEFEYDANSGKQ